MLNIESEIREFCMPNLFLSIRFAQIMLTESESSPTKLLATASMLGE